ncbi:MAG: hypothetical protein KatS3mg112_0065 [Thermogutta sp.]|nr:MAG: hypothetical protein KatS3mg112_0065 [Thermogutta sp.]
MECGALAPLSARDFSPRGRKWMIQRCTADLTSRSLRGMFRRERFSKNRRGTLVVPGEGEMDDPTLNHGPDKRVPLSHGLEGRVPFRPIHPSTDPPSTLAGAPVTVQNRQEKSKLAYRAGWRSGIPGNQPGSVPPCRVVQSPGDSTGQIHLPRRRTWVPASRCGMKTHPLAFP